MFHCALKELQIGQQKTAGKYSSRRFEALPSEELLNGRSPLSSTMAGRHSCENARCARRMLYIHGNGVLIYFSLEQESGVFVKLAYESESGGGLAAAARVDRCIWRVRTSECSRQHGSPWCALESRAIFQKKLEALLSEYPMPRTQNGRAESAKSAGPQQRCEAGVDHPDEIPGGVGDLKQDESKISEDLRSLPLLTESPRGASVTLASAKAFGKLVRDAQKATLARCDEAKLDRETKATWPQPYRWGFEGDFAAQNMMTAFGKARCRAKICQTCSEANLCCWVAPKAQCLSLLGGLVLKRVRTRGAALRVVGDSRSTPLSPPGGTRASARRGTLSPWLLYQLLLLFCGIYPSEVHACPDSGNSVALDYRACASFH